MCEWDLLNKQIRTQVKPDGGALVAISALPNGNLIIATEEGSILEVASNGQVGHVQMNEIKFTNRPSLDHRLCLGSIIPICSPLASSTCLEIKWCSSERKQVQCELTSIR